MSVLSLLLAAIGASLILGVLMCGPLIDRLLARRTRRSA
jgi:predicted MFS family arabinose efflux permease